jgi:uncharacterized protein YcbK (DUF882 family)
MGDTERRNAPGSFILNRRRLLHLGGAMAASAALAPPPAFAAIAAHPDRSLQLRLAHTGETFAGTYWSQGQYIPDALGRIGTLLRDQHTDQVKAIDPRLLDLLHALKRQLGMTQPYEVVCGYRSPETNRLLREEGKRAAKHSLHITGQAVDVRFHDRNLRQVYDAARALRAGGVGYYGRAQFVHLDVGEVRHWESGGTVTRPRSRPRQSQQL